MSDPTPTVTVSTVAQLITAIKAATSAETILLEPGTYSNLKISNINVPGGLTIASADSSNVAHIVGAAIKGSTGITFSDVEFSTSTTDYSKATKDAIKVVTSNAINFDQVTFSGYASDTRATAITGIDYVDCNNCSVTDSTFYEVHNGMNVLDSDGITINNNTFSYVWADGIDFAGTSDVMISGNNFSTMDMDNISGHSDCIESWTRGTTTVMQNITIQNNTYTRGVNGGYAHMIELTEHTGTLPPQNVTITGNAAYGSSLIGIKVNGANNVLIKDNTAVAYDDITTTIGAQNCTNVTIEDNAAPKFTNKGNTNVTFDGNTINTPIPVPTSSLASFMSSFGTQGAGAGAGSGSGQPQTPQSPIIVGGHG
jgi:parallel beta-helix repeat protein